MNRTIITCMAGLMTWGGISLICRAGPMGTASTNQGWQSRGGEPTEAAAEAKSTPLPSGASKSWWAGAQENIRQSEYHITWQEKTNLPDLKEAWQAPNRAQNLRTYFTPEGIRVIRRMEKTPSWQWGMQLRGYGHAGAVKPVAPAQLVIKDNRIEYQRGDLIEWYVNEEKGLEQGFTLKAPPAGPDRQDAEIVLELKATGNLKGRLTDNGNRVSFADGKGEVVINYGKLHVSDAQDRQLPARFCLDKGQLLLRIDAADAVYPLTIDPVITGGLSTTADWTDDSDQVGAYFGFSVSTAGDIKGNGYTDIIVGASSYDNGESDEGRAFVYYGSANGLSSTADWIAESNQVGANFGCSVATAGDVNGDGYADVIVGAYRYDNGQTDEGRAFVWHGSAMGLGSYGTPTNADWTAESDQASAYFGYSVSTAGDVDGNGCSDIIIGACYYDDGQSNEGAAFVWYGSTSGLGVNGNPTNADWQGQSDQANAWLGFSVSTAGDVNGDGYADIIVGAHQYESNTGRAFVWYGSASGLGADGTPGNADWTGVPDQYTCKYGVSVSTAGDVNGDGYADIIVGASEYNNGETAEGAAFVYHGADPDPSTTPDWMAESNQNNSSLGCSVSTAGDVNGDGYADVIVGAAMYDNGQTDEGAAFAWYGSSSGLGTNGNPTNADWMAEGNQADASFGYSVATAGDVDGDGYAEVIVGAYRYDNGQTDEGRAFVYHGTMGGLSADPDWRCESDQSNAVLGVSVSTAGDINGDGYADVIAGSMRYDKGQTNEGAVFVWYGSSLGLGSNGNPTNADWMAEGDQDEAYFGLIVSTAGDVNSDGYADIIVGAYLYDNGEADEGAAFVWYGSASGLGANGTPANADWMAEGDQENALFGRAASTAGDVNGDGYADVIVGAYYYDSGETNEGKAYVYHGSALGPSASPDWTAESDQADAYFGVCVSTAGDVNGDGYADVIVGASGYDNGEDGEGRAYVYHGSADGLTTSPGWIAEPNQVTAVFGCSVSTAGDVNGDGYADVIVGAIYYDNGENDEGAAFVYHGSASGLSTSPNWIADSDQADAHFGNSVSTAGDVNGDGYADVIIGAYHYDNPYTSQGQAFVYHGSSSGLSLTADWTGQYNESYLGYGISVATAGDVNGDGYAEVIIGATGYGADEGAAFVYYGNEGSGLSLKPRQFRSFVSQVIGPLGVSDRPDSFRLAALGRTPFGRGKVKLEWEVKLLGTLFDGTNTGQSAIWMDTGTAGVELDELVSGLMSNKVYHWRVRLLYHPATIPYQQRSRWITIPWNGWQEADLRTKCELLYDLNGDCFVNMYDLALLASEWLK